MSISGEASDISCVQLSWSTAHAAGENVVGYEADGYLKEITKGQAETKPVWVKVGSTNRKF